MPIGLVVKNGSKMRGQFSALMPQPVSATSIQTESSVHQVRIVIIPRVSPIDWAALTIRFMTT